MSIQWTFIAGYLYFEIAVVILMMLPIFSPRRWHQFFKSRLFFMFRNHAAVYFYVLLGILGVFLMDSVREMKKYAHSPEGHVHLSSEMKGNVKLFRAQRNFYITGFAIFLAFVIRRLVTMLIIQDELSLKAERIIKQAEDTVNSAKTMVLSNTMQASETQKLEEMIQDLEKVKSERDEHRARVRELEEEATKWRLMYEEVCGAGDAKTE
ncbi:B-cell receptor-associated protein 31-like [Plodia interpunctella]|uniref:B-cell receptor-associated protein 31-like n=1 Tax=Plodia interpunctella TaxID=58824 RepID=UPI002367A2FD|nr:B-cell receptor-associated protein 31-like [Plodia interpunctella]